MMKELTAALALSDAVIFAYLFGSQARGDVHGRSDADIAVMLDTDADTLDTELSLRLAFSKALHKEVDLVVLNRIKNYRLLQTILKEGVVLKESKGDERSLFEVSAHHDILDYAALKRSIDAA